MMSVELVYVLPICFQVKLLAPGYQQHTYLIPRGRYDSYRDSYSGFHGPMPSTLLQIIVWENDNANGIFVDLP